MNDDLVEHCEHLFSSNANWDTLRSLHFQQMKPVSDPIFACIVKQECLRALQALKLSIIEARFPQTVPLPNLKELDITVTAQSFMTNISNIGDAAEREVLPSLATLIVTQIHEGIGPVNMQTIMEKEIMDLGMKLEGYLPKEVVFQVTGSISNVLVNAQNNMHSYTHAELTGGLACQSLNAAQIERICHLNLKSSVSDTLDTLRESLTAEHRKYLQLVLEVFWQNLTRIVKPDKLQFMLNENILTFPALKLMLPKPSVRLFFHNTLDFLDSETNLDTLFKREREKNVL